MVRRILAVLMGAGLVGACGSGAAPGASGSTPSPGSANSKETVGHVKWISPGANMYVGGMVGGPDGSVWVSEFQSSTYLASALVHLDPSGSVLATHPAAACTAYEFRPALTADGSVWASRYGVSGPNCHAPADADGIARYDRQGNFTFIQTNNVPSYLSAGRDGAVYGLSAASYLKITADGTLTSSATKPGGDIIRYNQDPVAGPDGRLYVMALALNQSNKGQIPIAYDFTTDKITSIPIPDLPTMDFHSDGFLGSLGIGGDGGLWFTRGSVGGANIVGTIRSDGKVDEYQFEGTAYTNPNPHDDVVAGPGGLTWFTGIAATKQGGGSGLIRVASDGTLRPCVVDLGTTFGSAGGDQVPVMARGKDAMGIFDTPRASIGLVTGC